MLWYTVVVMATVWDTDQVDLVSAVLEHGDGLLVVHILQGDSVDTHDAIIDPKNRRYIA